MHQKINLSDMDTQFEEKVYVIADETLKILKELSKENKKQINSKTIAEKMFWRDSVKNILVNSVHSTSDDTNETNHLKELSHSLLDKLTHYMPQSITPELSDLKEKLDREKAIELSQEWIESPIKIIRKYIDSISGRNKELTDFIQQTVSSLGDTEGYLTSELSSHKQKYQQDRRFENDISANMNKMKRDCDTSGDLKSIKLAIMKRLENINREIERKRDHDIELLKETEIKIEEMGKHIVEIKRDADEIRKKAHKAEIDSLNDNLTGLYNRRAYDQKMTEILAHVERYDIPASLLVCDIDFFKKINDTYGHKVGDLALKKLGSLLKKRLRINDFVSRYGGEEFAIILPHTELDGATLAGEGIRSYIHKSVFSYQDEKIPLTISVGISQFRKGEDIFSIFERADKALYLAKSSGRNRVKTENDILNESASLTKDTLNTEPS